MMKHFAFMLIILASVVLSKLKILFAGTLNFFFNLVKYLKQLKKLCIDPYPLIQYISKGTPDRHAHMWTSNLWPQSWRHTGTKGLKPVPV